MKYKYKLILVIPIWLMANRILAQETPKFTLEQCIEYALQNSVNVQNILLDEQIASSKVKETIGIGLPQITANANATSNPQLPRFFGTKQRMFGFSGLTPSDYPNFFPNLKDNDVMAAQNFFQLKNSLNTTVTVNQLIFNGSYLVGLKASSTFKELATKSTLQTKEQTIELVTKAFYTALINNERIKLFENNISRVDSLLKNTTALNVNGFAESIDVDRIQVSLNNLVTEKSNFERLQVVSIEALKFQMNYPMDQSMEISGNISDISIDILLDNYTKDWNYKNRPDYQVLETNKKLQELNVKNKYAAGMPVLSASATLGYSKQANSYSNLFAPVPTFTEVNGIGPGKMYPYSSIGVNLSIPIFSGLQRSNQLQQEKLKLEKINNSFKSLKSGIDLQIKQAVTNYLNSMQSLESQKKNMKLADKVARVTKIKYQQGIGSNIEVVDAESSLKESQVNYYNALYNALIAKTDLDKAFGKLLPANTTQN
ncbi:MAG: TolC family protein [Bacteroidetes bacterium]|nr:TolC family protein [Bacteroidota bacterium]